MFLATAVVLEDTGVTAYDGQGTRLTKATLARRRDDRRPSRRATRRGCARSTTGRRLQQRAVRPYPAPSTLQPQKSMDQVTAAVTATGFIKG